MIKTGFVTLTLSAVLAMGFLAPATPASATPNSSRLAQCERAAAERFARKAMSGDQTKARRQFNNDIARCKRQFG